MRSPSERRARPRQLGIEKADVEAGVVGDQRGIADELEELLGDILEQRLVLQELGGEAVHVHRVAMDVALGFEVAVELAAGGDAVDDLDAADLDQPVAVGWRRDRSSRCP